MPTDSGNDDAEDFLEYRSRRSNEPAVPSPSTIGDARDVGEQPERQHKSPEDSTKERIIKSSRIALKVVLIVLCLIVAVPIMGILALLFIFSGGEPAIQSAIAVVATAIFLVILATMFFKNAGIIVAAVALLLLLTISSAIF